MARPPGSAVGRYQIQSFVTRGETTVIYEALDPVSGLTVALKILPPSAARDPDIVKRFLSQADQLRQLNHENILPVVDYGWEGGIPFVALPVAEGGALEGRMAAYHEPRLALLLVAALAHALDYAHENGLVHGRIGPRHILFSAEGKPLLTGFGRPYSARVPGAVPAYVAPEQQQGFQPDGRTDIYQLGALLFELLLGRSPEPDPDFAADAELAALPDDVQTILSRTLAGVPDERFETIGELADLAMVASQRQAAAALQAKPAEGAGLESDIARPGEDETPPHAAPPPGHDKDPTWLVVAGIGLILLLAICCLMAVYAAFLVNDRLNGPQATALEDANLRSGPALEYEIVGLLRKDEKAAILGISPDGRWWQIEFDGAPNGRAWVPADFVVVDETGNIKVIQPPTLTPFPATYAPWTPTAKPWSPRQACPGRADWPDRGEETWLLLGATGAVL